MPERRQRTENVIGKDAESAADDSPAETPMERFARLARKLVNVPKREVIQERRKSATGKRQKSSG